MSFAIKSISVNFAMQGGVSKTLSNKRISCTITNSGGPSLGMAELIIYGMTLSDMNALSTVGNQIGMMKQNKIAIYAGDQDAASGSLPLIFQGTILVAWTDAQAQPEVGFRVQAFAGGYESVAPQTPITQQGSVTVSSLFQQIGKNLGWQIDIGQIDTKVSNPYLPGTAIEQVRRLAQMGGVSWAADLNTIAVVKPGQASSQGGAVMLSAQTGMVGYPAFTQSSIIVKSLFNPSLKILGSITVQSQLQPANGTWVINNITHVIESQTPNGQWFSTVVCNLLGAQPDTTGDSD